MAQGWRAPNVRRVRGVTFHVAASKSTRRAISFLSSPARVRHIGCSGPPDAEIVAFFLKSHRQKVLSAQLPLSPPHFQRLHIGSLANEINVRDAGNVPSGMPGDGTRYFCSFWRCVFINLEISQNKNLQIENRLCQNVSVKKKKKLSCKCMR